MCGVKMWISYREPTRHLENGRPAKFSVDAFRRVVWTIPSKRLGLPFVRAVASSSGFCYTFRAV